MRPLDYRVGHLGMTPQSGASARRLQGSGRREEAACLIVMPRRGSSGSFSIVLGHACHGGSRIPKRCRSHYGMEQDHTVMSVLVLMICSMFDDFVPKL